CMLIARTAVAIGGNAMDGVIAHVGDDRIGIRGTVCPSDQMPVFKHVGHALMEKIDKLIGIVTVGSPVRDQALSVYPLTYNYRPAAPGYLVLDEALSTGEFGITEISESGSVPRLLAINDNNAPVFLLDGEELVGAKQNRVLNLSIMLAPRS